LLSASDGDRKGERESARARARARKKRDAALLAVEI